VTDFDVDVDRYLARIGFDRDPRHDLATLTDLQRAHMSTVAFENLDVYRGTDVLTDVAWSIPKIVDRNRGGWCFEVNGAFAALLARVGAAVLLQGPNTTIDHLTLEVVLDKPYLVDVGFGDCFINPLELNSAGPQDGGNGTFELVRSTEGLTLCEHDEVGVPIPQYRFNRVARVMSDFVPASDSLQHDPELHWSKKPFATRLLDNGPDRVTLLGDRLKITRGGVVKETPVAAEEWADTLDKWFAMRVNLAADDR